MGSLRQIEEIQAEVNDYRDRIALLRAQLYRRRGIRSDQRLEQLLRRLHGAQRRLGQARSAIRP